ncbi:MAG: hypothetical protein JSW55_12520 [Chloroflexota bacterium]|nr:MAG: hypothetical protein JSW55_12520 [Chloroflexota bacterium]
MLIAMAAAAPLFFDAGLLNTRGGGDSPFLLQRLHQLSAAVADGHFPVRWMPDANYGYGYPFYNYYAPLSIYIAALWRFLGAGFVLAIKLAQLSGFVVAAWGMYQLGRRWLGNHWAGLLAAAAYTLAPFHMVNVYVRGDSLAEFWAMALYPLVILAVDHLASTTVTQQANHSVRKRRRLGIALLAIVYAALILSHNISALIFTPFLLLYLAFDGWPKAEEAYNQGGHQQNAAPAQKSIWRTSRGRHLTWAILSLSLALALAAWFWLPALAESSIAQLGPVTEGHFHYGNHFRDSNLVQGTFLFNYDTVDGRAFSMGLVQTITLVLGAIALVLYGRRPPYFVSRGRQLYIFTGLLLATFMITSLSSPIWDNLPLLSFTQFPWRFLSIQAFFGSLAAAGLALLPGRRLIVPLVVILLAVSSLAGLRLDFLPLTDADITVERLAQYEWYSGNIGTTISAEYLPDTVQPRPWTSQWLNRGQRDELQVLAGEIVAIKPLSMSSARQEWQITAGDAGATVTMPTMAWPGWSGTLDGNRVDLDVAEGSGLIMLTVPAGEHTVELQLGRTPIRLASEIAALATLFICAWLVVTSKHWPFGRKAIYFVSGLLLLSVILRLLPEAELRADVLNWDFGQLAYLHHADEEIVFENGARLESYSYSSDEVSAGETLLITLNWADGAAEQANLSLTTPAANRGFRPPPFSRQYQDIRLGAVPYSLAIPENAPSGLVLPRLAIPGAKALTPSGLQRGHVFLRPILLGDKPQPAGVAEDLLDARAVQVTPRGSDLLDLQLQWLTRRPLTENYNYSLRLVDGRGGEVASSDGQPGHGYLPSSGWPTNLWVDDWISMKLPQSLQDSAPEGPFALVIRLYDTASKEAVLTRLLGQMNWQDGQLHFSPGQPVFDVPAQASPLSAGFGRDVGLAGYALDHHEDRLNLTLYWHARAAIQLDLFHFVHVEDADGLIVAQHDSMPRRNTYPTSQWRAGEVVADDMDVDLSELPAGNYSLYVGLYRLQDGQAHRLPISGAEDQATSDQRLKLSERIVVE